MVIIIQYKTDDPRFLEEVPLLLDIPREHQVVENVMMKMKITRIMFCSCIGHITL